MENNFRADNDSIGLYTNGTLYGQPVDSRGVVIGPAFSLGLIDGIEATFEATKIDLFSSLRGARSKFHTVTTEKNGTISLTFRNFNAKNMSLYTYGELTSKAAVMAKSETVKIWAGAWTKLASIPKAFTSLTYDTKILELGKNYEISKGGVIYIYPVAEQTAKGATNIVPAEADGVDAIAVYDTKAFKRNEAFVKDSVRLRLFYNGLNTADNSEHEITAVFYLVELDPTTVPFASTEDFGSATVTGSLLAARSIEGAGLSQYLQIDTVEEDVDE